MEALGIDGRLLIAQIVNFGILLFVLNKVLYKPLIKLLDERKKNIKDALANNLAIENKLAEISEKEKEILKTSQIKAGEQADKLIEMASEEKRKLIEEARILAEKETQKGIERIKAAEAEAQKRIKVRFTKDVVEEITQKLYKENYKNCLSAEK